ncbi:amino acid permease [Candidatus Woesearchaeota archaeon]|jgi:tyrosine-specific transport protein|nr:amino acid permease [Candidatus Woesearchaeota archaeon]MBT4336200.1 amino acid permease [Candidatus Woesearchaeota archaeon]MBT4468821.1 amino acid permease [Candidatus Woesearchaeota archaeon]MBT6744860.1 amino acid permease [Candidatus Woesearchaeota archaeon]
MLKKRGSEEKGFFANHKLAIASTTLIGTIIGAGILGIPYVIAKTGFVYGLLLIILLGGAYVFLNLFLGEVILRTKKQHQLPGYAEKYLGKWGKRLMTLSMFIGLYGALTAYLIGEGAALHTIFGWGVPLMYTFIFFAITVYIIYRGIKATGKAELILISLLFLVVVFIGLLSYNQIQFSNLVHFDLTKILVPYGVIVFAFVGLPSIPEMQEELGREKKKMKKAILVGSVIPIVLYIAFSLIIIGIVGLENFELLGPNERIATIALSLYSNQILGIFANLLAVLAMFTSFLTIGTALVEIFEYDYGVSRRTSLLLTFSLPLLIVLFKLTSFIVVLGITGAIAGGLDGILVMLMYWKAKKLGDRKPEYTMGKHYILGVFLILMFVVGIAYQFF